MFVAIELIEAGTSRRQENDVARGRGALTISVPLACASIFAAAVPIVYTRFTRSFSSELRRL